MTDDKDGKLTDRQGAIAYDEHDADRGRITPEPNQPFVALNVFWVVAILVGAIMLGVGISNFGSYSSSLYSVHTDNGIAEMLWGAVVLNLGVVAAMVALGVAAVLWRLNHVPKKARKK